MRVLVVVNGLVNLVARTNSPPYVFRVCRESHDPFSVATYHITRAMDSSPLSTERTESPEKFTVPDVLGCSDHSESPRAEGECSCSNNDLHFSNCNYSVRIRSLLTDCQNKPVGDQSLKLKHALEKRRSGLQKLQRRLQLWQRMEQQQLQPTCDRRI